LNSRASNTRHAYGLPLPQYRSIAIGVAAVAELGDCTENAT
jgi:hypothetical protein